MATSVPKNLLIFGATGQIGMFITEAILAANPPFKRVVVFTSPATVNSKSTLLSSWKSRGASVVAGDVTSDVDVSAAYKDIDTVVSCVGRNVLSHQIDLITLAEAAGVKWFFPSEYGTDVEYGPKSANEKPHQLKLAVRRHLRENVKSLKYTFLVTGPYSDMWFYYNPGHPEAGGFDPVKKTAVVIDDGEGKIGLTTMKDVGKCAVAALKHPEASFNRALKVQSFVVTPNQVLAEFKRQTGGGAWSVTSTPLAKLIELENEAWKKGDPTATGFTLRRIWAEGGTLYEKTDNESIGLGQADMETLETSVKEMIEGFRR